MLKAEGVLTRNSGDPRSPRLEGDSTVRRGLELSPLRDIEKHEGHHWLSVDPEVQGAAQSRGRNQEQNGSTPEVFYKMSAFPILQFI